MQTDVAKNKKKKRLDSDMENNRLLLNILSIENGDVMQFSAERTYVYVA